MPQYQSVLELSSLDGSNGFRVNGESVKDYSGGSVASAGDINGDGYDDMIVGAPGANTNGAGSGASYVIFGNASGFGATLDLSALDANDGFQINGEATGAQSGFSVASAGDFNGDGFADLIVGAPLADPNGDFSGASYVVFGKASGFGTTLNLYTLVGSNGFQISGEAPFDRSGSSVASAGDINGDGFADLVVGAKYAGSFGSLSGASYVVFGKASGFAATLDLSSLDGTNGFQINGEADEDYSGCSVASAGDVNGDGVADLIVGAYGAGYSGVAYVVFGKASGFGATLNLSTLHGNSGFKISGAVYSNYTGASVASAGDVNGDGFADLIVGARYGDSSYVVFGKASGFGAALDLSTLDGTNGFRMSGEAGGHTGASVASAGDFNGDGFDDLIVGAVLADSHGNYSGASYVVFGKALGFDATLDLSTLDGNNGFRINGEAANDHSGASVASAGDINGDGLDDLIVGAPGADLPYATNAGASYVIYGALPTGPVNREGTNIANTIHGGNSTDVLSGLKGNDILFGHGGNDAMFGGVGNDTIYGGDGNDLIDGGTGIDIVFGEGGNDRILAGADFAGGKVVDGGAGTDTVVLDGRYNGVVLTGAQLHDVEFVELAAGHGYKLSVDNSLLASGAYIIIDGRGLGAHDKLVFNGKGEHDGLLELYGGAGKDKLTLGDGGGYAVSSLGHDTLTAGNGADTFYFDLPTTSTGREFDTVARFDFSGTPGITSDLFDVSSPVMGIDATIAGGMLGKTNFDADLAHAADATHLFAGHAVLFTPDEGNYHNKTFLIIDQNGLAGYQSGHDIVIQLKAPIDLASIDTGDFYTFF